jgi:chorismate mutase/prephenate dehydratase
VEYHPAGSIDDVFAAVETGSADYGVVPVENSTEGAVTNTFDRFTGTTLKICNEIYLPISLCLMAKVPMDQITRICTKHEAIGQCRRWLGDNMSGVEYDAVASTTIAAEMAARGECAAIASRFAAELYGLDVIAENIQDASGNTTRFLVIGKTASEQTGNDKTSIYFGIKDKVGALHDTLDTLKLNGINMSKIESRPSGDKLWEYVFFVDFEGHADSPNVKKALEEMEEHCAVLTVLGSYPKAD